MTCQSPTHHLGCACHEARRDAELAAVTKERDEALKNEQASATAYAASRAECAVLRGTLEGLAKEAQGFIKCHEWEIRCNAGNSNIAVMETRIKWANEALSTSSGEALAAVRTAIDEAERVSESLREDRRTPVHLEKALAELKKIFGDV